MASTFRASDRTQSTHTNFPQPLLSYAFSAMRIQVSSAFLKVTQKMKGGISTNTLKGSAYTRTCYTFMGVTVSVSKVPEDPQVPQEVYAPKQTGMLPAGLGVQPCAPVPLSLLPEIKELARHWPLVHRRNTGVGICRFHICTMNSPPLFLTD